MTTAGIVLDALLGLLVLVQIVVLLDTPDPDPRLGWSDKGPRHDMAAAERTAGGAR